LHGGTTQGTAKQNATIKKKHGPLALLCKRTARANSKGGLGLKAKAVAVPGLQSRALKIQ
jgi:hypothetical protein